MLTRDFVSSSSPVPKDGITMRAAADKYGIATETIRQLIVGGQLKAGIGSGSGKPVLVSQNEIESLIATKNTRLNADIVKQPPTDGEPVNSLAREFGITDDAIRSWCRWDIHPGIGRKLRSGIGSYTLTTSDGRERRWRGLLVSRTDVAACVRAIKKPIHHRFPGNPGRWIVDGIFQHDDKRLFYTDRYITDHRDRFGMPPRSLSLSCYSSKLASIKVVWPEPGPRVPWTVTVYPEDDLQRLAEWREGKTDNGRWLTPNDTWQDDDGVWFSSMHVAEAFEIDHLKMSGLRSDGFLTRFKVVPRDHVVDDDGNKSGGRSVYVHHADEINVILGNLPEVGEPEPMPTAEKRTKTEPAERQKVETEPTVWDFRLVDVHPNAAGKIGDVVEERMGKCIEKIIQVRQETQQESIELPSVSDKGLAILAAMKKSHPARLSVLDFETNDVVSRNTASKHLSILHEKQLISYPEGKPNGPEITSLGLKVLASLPTR